MAKARRAIPEGHHTVTPHLVFDKAAEAIEWYKKAFGAQEVARALGPDGKIMHAEIRIGDSLIMLNDAMGGGKPQPTAFWVYVEDCDALFNRAVAAGGKVLPSPMGPMANQFWGDRAGTLTDPYGHQWSIATHVEDLTPQEIDERMNAFMKNFAAQGANR